MIARTATMNRVIALESAAATMAQRIKRIEQGPINNDVMVTVAALGTQVCRLTSDVSLTSNSKITAEDIKNFASLPEKLGSLELELEEYKEKTSALITATQELNEQTHANVSGIHYTQVNIESLGDDLIEQHENVDGLREDISDMAVRISTLENHIPEAEETMHVLQTLIRRVEFMEGQIAAVLQHGIGMRDSMAIRDPLLPLHECSEPTAAAGMGRRISRRRGRGLTCRPIRRRRMASSRHHGMVPMVMDAEGASIQLGE